MRRIFADFLFLICISSISLAAQAKPDALVLYREGKYTESINVCLGEIKETPQNIESHVVLCWSLVAAGRYEEADQWAIQGRTLSKYDPRLIEVQAEAEYYTGKNDSSLRLFQEYISYAPNGSRLASAYFFMGEIYLRLAQYRHADISFSTALQLENMNVNWWVRLGYAREKAGDYRYALDAYNQALTLDGTNQDALRGKNRVLKYL